MSDEKIKIEWMRKNDQTIENEDQWMNNRTRRQVRTSEKNECNETIECERRNEKENIKKGLYQGGKTVNGRTRKKYISTKKKKNL